MFLKFNVFVILLCGNRYRYPEPRKTKSRWNTMVFITRSILVFQPESIRRHVPMERMRLLFTEHSRVSTFSQTSRVRSIRVVQKYQ